MEKFLHLRLIISFCVLLTTLNVSFSQEQKYLAVIPPFQDRDGELHTEGLLQLVHQQFVLFVYQDAVAAYSEAHFRNISTDTIVQELALPSTNYEYSDSGQNSRISKGILGIQLRVENEKVEPEFLVEGDKEWYTINLKMGPAQQAEVRSLFWTQTSLTDIDSIPGIDTTIIPDGKRGFVIDLSNTAIWNGFIESINVVVVLKDGLTIKSKNFNAEPYTYDLQDSILTWEMSNVEPSSDYNIVVLYTSSHKPKNARNTMAKLSRYIVSTVYDELLSYVNRKQEE